MTILTRETLSLPACKVEEFSPTFSIYRLVPGEAQHPWILELYDIAERTTPHHHRIKTQTYVLLEGRAKFLLGTTETLLEARQIVTIPPGVFHTIEPESALRLLVVDWPNLMHPEDYYEEMPKHSTASAFILPFKLPHSLVNKADSLPPSSEEKPIPLPTAAYQHRVEGNGYVAYEICADTVHHSWSVAILDVTEAPPHFHKKEIEHFIVLSGTLKIDLEGIPHTLTSGQSVHIKPNTIHHLQSANSEPVRVLCVSFPAFDEKDFYPIG